MNNPIKNGRQLIIIIFEKKELFNSKYNLLKLDSREEEGDAMGVGWVGSEQ